MNKKKNAIVKLRLLEEQRELLGTILQILTDLNQKAATERGLINNIFSNIDTIQNNFHTIAQQASQRYIMGVAELPECEQELLLISLELNRLAAEKHQTNIEQQKNYAEARKNIQEIQQVKKQIEEVSDLILSFKKKWDI